jgi:regulatory protein
MVRNKFPNKSEKSKRKSRTAIEAALFFLGYRARSEKEIIDRLLLKKFPDAEIAQAMVKLKGWGFVNDSEFAKTYVESRTRSKPRSSRLISLELKRKGIEPQDLPDMEKIDNYEMARMALSKKKNIKTFEQAARFLASRGFSWEVIEKVAKKEYNWDDVNSK